MFYTFRERKSMVLAFWPGHIRPAGKVAVNESQGRRSDDGEVGGLSGGLPGLQERTFPRVE